MAKCSKCGKEIPNTGEESPNWKLYCKECSPKTVEDMIAEVSKLDKNHKNKQIT
jgi:hypothetical protein